MQNSWKKQRMFLLYPYEYIHALDTEENCNSISQLGMKKKNIIFLLFMENRVENKCNNKFTM